VTARDVTEVRSVRDIPRLCACHWSQVLRCRRPAGWRLAFAVEGCRFHGLPSVIGAAA
jgi:hypothetical protein